MQWYTHKHFIIINPFKRTQGCACNLYFKFLLFIIQLCNFRRDEKALIKYIISEIQETQIIGCAQHVTTWLNSPRMLYFILLQTWLGAIFMCWKIIIKRSIDTAEAGIPSCLSVRTAISQGFLKIPSLLIIPLYYTTKLTPW